ncbi:MAG: hypothetical protein C5B59_00930 [Bacteroidetes bacterium]|nr:MAG: hypothetical protein C5B59_00930 [Bacteroidota bacterium]
MYLCTNCLSLDVTKIERFIVCNKCSFKKPVVQYNRELEKAKMVVRFGYQYRKRQENDRRLNPKVKRAYYLPELDDIFGFLGLAVLNGVIGGLAYDAIKKMIKQLLNDPLVIKIDDEDFKKFLKSEREQEKFIKYIQAYRNKNLSSQGKKTAGNKGLKKNLHVKSKKSR